MNNNKISLGPDISKPITLLRHKEYQVINVNQNKFIINFKDFIITDVITSEYIENYDKLLDIINIEQCEIRVFKNSKLLSKDDYTVNLDGRKQAVITTNEICVDGDIIHVDIFISLTRYNQYSVCIADNIIINCIDGVNEYDFNFEHYSKKTYKLQIIHSRLGFIPKYKYNIINNKIKFVDIDFESEDVLYIKLIQDGGILLQ